MYLLSSPDKKKSQLMIKESILGTNIFSIRCYLLSFVWQIKNPNCTKHGILFPKLFWPSVRNKNLKFEAEGREFAKFLRSIEQFIQAMKGQNNFFNLFLEVSHVS